MKMPPVARFWALPSIALLGLLAGHQVTYLGLTGSSSEAQHWMAATGHGYLQWAGFAATALALIASLFVFALGIARKAGRALTIGRLLPLLCSIQLAGFGAQEVLERTVAGAPLHDLPAVLLLGIPVQVLVAIAAAIVAAGLYKAGEAVRRLLARLPRNTRPLLQFPSVALSPVARYSGSGRCTRGPPSVRVW